MEPSGHVQVEHENLGAMSPYAAPRRPDITRVGDHRQILVLLEQ